MVVSTQMSFIIAAVSAILIFSGMQMYRPWFISSQVNHLIGGYLGSMFFTFAFTALSNLESCVFGKSFQVKLFPEAILCLSLALFATATLHRVCVTSCLLFSLVSLYFINSYSQRANVVMTPAAVVHSSKKKK